MPRTKVKDLRMHSALFIIHMCIVRTVVICRGACRVWLRPYELCIIWMRLHSYEWGFIHMNEALFIWMRPHLYEWGIIHMNEASSIRVRHHPYEWYEWHSDEGCIICMRQHSYHLSHTRHAHMSHMHDASFIWMRHHSYEWGIMHMNYMNEASWVYDLSHTRHAHMSVWPQSYTARSYESCEWCLIHINDE